VECLFGNSVYAPQQQATELSMLSGTTHLGGCRGDIENEKCTHHSYALSFDPGSKEGIVPAIDYQVGHGYTFRSSPDVAVDPITAPEGSIFAVRLLSASKTGFVIDVYNPLPTPDEGNHGWNGDLVVRWIAFLKPNPAR
jgi:hypothetical protein